MIAAADAELYLRLLVERCLLDGMHNSPGGGRVSIAGAALAAAGTLPLATAQTIVADYAQATWLRGRGGPIFHGGTPPAAGEPPSPPRVVACDHELPAAWGRMRAHFVVLADDRTTIDVTAEIAQHSMHSWQPPVLTVGDDRGTRSTARFSGGGGGSIYNGSLTATPPLSPDTAWIEVGGERIDLSASTPAVEMRIEPLPATDPVLGHLWRMLCHTNPAMPRVEAALDIAIEVLADIGALDPESPEVTQVRDVAAGLAGGTPPAGIPEPWATLIAGMRRRRTQSGPAGTVAVGAVTPPIDGATVLVDALVSDVEGFVVRAGAMPGAALGHLGQGLPAEPLTWWAEDDRGGVHLGGITDWQGALGYARGSVRFRPALDRHARELRLMPTGTTERAVLRIPLPWAAVQP